MKSNVEILTYYHKTLDANKIEKWIKTEFHNIWLFASHGSNQNKGYNQSNMVEIRIPMKEVKDTSLFKIGDIVCVGKQVDISTQSDLKGKEFYNVTNIRINNFGSTPHIHLGGN